MAHYIFVTVSLVLLLILIAMLLRSRNSKLLSKLKSEVYTWEQVSDPELRPLMRDFVGRLDRDLFRIGFRLYGNFRSVRRTSDSTCRYFLNDAGTISADCTPEVIALHSILSDGTIVETLDVKELPDVFRNLPQTSRLWLTAADTKNLDELLQRHLAELKKLSSERAVKPEKLEMESLGELNRYLLSLCDWNLFLAGHTLLRPTPSSFNLPINGESEFIFPGLQEDETLETLQSIKKIEKRSLSDYLPETSDDWKILIRNLLFYTVLVMAIGGVKLYSVADRVEATPGNMPVMYWSLPLFACVGLFVGVLFYANWKHVMATNKLQ